MSRIDSSEKSSIPEHWLALIIGNSRLHWAWFVDTVLQKTWDTSHLLDQEVERLIRHGFDFAGCGVGDVVLPAAPSWSLPDLWVASVVPEQMRVWQRHLQVRPIASAQIPLKNAYSSLGLDRALAIWGACEVYGSPVLVIDSGTALTFTGADEHRQFWGGAILPGLQLQFRSLHQATAALPLIETKTLGTDLPPRWAQGTIESMQSGILYTLLLGIRDFIEDWQRWFPKSPLVLTGGDSAILFQHLQQFPELANRIVVDSNLLFWGVRSLKQVLSI
ncbi:MAG: pantothenate kinase [Leptolyngbyaceae cyanobacterium CSU_1_3]|nr:pantothenate kinase [Leptolyngbyaceae cyanobacterium CSU_1_3]